MIENIARHMEMNKGKQERASRAPPRRCAKFKAPSSRRRSCCSPSSFPSAFFPGTTGQIYKQFALTIAASITISLFLALTLAPVLSARLLSGEYESKAVFFRWFNAGLQAFPGLVRARRCRQLFRRRWIVAGVFVAALLVTLFLA